MYINTDDIKKLVDNALTLTEDFPLSGNELRNDYGVMRGYFYAIQDILTKEDENE